MTRKTPQTNPRILEKLEQLGAWGIVRTDTDELLCVITATSKDLALQRAAFVSTTIANMPPDLSLLDAQECTTELKQAVATQSGYFFVLEPPGGLTSNSLN